MNVRSSLILCSGLAFLLTAACIAPAAEPFSAPEYEASSAYPAHPDWSDRPVSWSKLSDIEAWQRGPGPRQFPDYADEAELQLAEGRLTLARREAKGVSAPVLSGRLAAAEKGFEGLLEKRDLKALQRQRAERGLSEIHELRGDAPRAKPVAKAAAGPASAAPAALAIQPRSAWGAAGANARRMTPASAPWTRITIHHSAKYSKEIGTFSSGNVAATIHDIQTVHMRDRDYGDIGYHYLIDPTGRIWQGRSLEWQGAHASGSNNVGNIGICLLGDFNKERPDPRALASLEKLVDSLSEKNHISPSRVYGHSELRSTECPGDALMAWVSRYTAGATH